MIDPHLAIATASRTVHRAASDLLEAACLPALPDELRKRLVTVHGILFGEAAILEALAEDQLQLPGPEVPPLPLPAEENPDHAMPPRPARSFGLGAPRRLA